MTDAVMVPGGQERGKNTVRAHISCKLYTLSVAPPEVDDFGHYRKCFVTLHRCRPGEESKGSVSSPLRNSFLPLKWLQCKMVLTFANI